MFIGIIEKAGESHSRIYYNYDEFYRDTFSPETNHRIIRFEIRGRNYAERKACLQNIAIEYSLNYPEGIYMSEDCTIQSWFRENGRRYGLLREFEENAIC